MMRSGGDMPDRLGCIGRWASLKRNRQMEVPDVSLGVAGLRKRNSGCIVPAVVPEKDESLPMEAEDNLPASSFPLHHPGIGNASFTVPSPFAGKLQSLEQREIQPNERDVDADFFAHLLIFYMIKEDWAKARQCRLRAESTRTNVNMNTLILICHHMENDDTGAALRLIKNSHFENPMRELITEVHKRITFSVLRMVEHTYINIEAKKLAEMLDAELNNELQKILDRVGWLQEDGYVVPKMTPLFIHQIEELNASPYGPIPQAFARVTKTMFKDTVDINKLIQYATFLEINT